MTILYLLGLTISLFHPIFSSVLKHVTGLVTVRWFLGNHNLLHQKKSDNVFLYFLDVSKAFDIANYGKLFRLNIKRRFPVVFVSTLVNLYMGNLIRVIWCGVLSEYFLATNGVEQGGFLSHILFCLYR